MAQNQTAPNGRANINRPRRIKLADYFDVSIDCSEPGDIVTLIAADTETYRRYYENKLVKKTLNIHSWLNERAENANINFSQTLQRALQEELRLTVSD
jgi:hypothetical protein